MPREQGEFNKDLAAQKARIVQQQRQASENYRIRQEQTALARQLAADKERTDLQKAEKELQTPLSQITREMNDPTMHRYFHELFRRYGGLTQKVMKKKGFFGKEQQVEEPLPYSLKRSDPRVLPTSDTRYVMYSFKKVRTADQQHFLEGGMLHLELNGHTFELYFWKPGYVSVKVLGNYWGEWKGSFTFAQLKSGLLNAIAAFDLGQKGLYTDIGLTLNTPPMENATY